MFSFSKPHLSQITCFGEAVTQTSCHICTISQAYNNGIDPLFFSITLVLILFSSHSIVWQFGNIKFQICDRKKGFQIRKIIHRKRIWYNVKGMALISNSSRGNEDYWEHMSWLLFIYQRGIRTIRVIYFFHIQQINSSCECFRYNCSLKPHLNKMSTAVFAFLSS